MSGAAVRNGLVKRGESVELVVLGLLVERPGHGYALHARLEERAGDLAHVSPSRVYSILARLERDGLVDGRDERTGRRRRRVYTIRGAGRRELRRRALDAHAWMSALLSAACRAAEGRTGESRP